MKTVPEETGEGATETEYTDEEFTEALEQELPAEEAAQEFHEEQAAASEEGHPAVSPEKPPAVSQAEPAAASHEEALPEEETISDAPSKKKRKYAGTPETIDEKFENFTGFVKGEYSWDTWYKNQNQNQ